MSTAPMAGTVLVARLDNAGDVLLAGPAVRAVAAHVDKVVMLTGPHGSAAATLLPGVDEVIEWCAPWIDPHPAPVTTQHVAALQDAVRAHVPQAALLLTSFHQSPLPLALLLRLAGVGWIGAISEDYPGSLLDLRHHVDGDPPEAQRGLDLADAAGYRLPAGDDGRLTVRRPLPSAEHLTGASGYVVLHPGASVPAREWPVQHCAGAVRALTAAGYRVLVTGSACERHLTAQVAGGCGVDLGGRTDLRTLAAVLDGAAVVIVGNTGPAHLAAAVGTPVVSLFAPVVPAARWAPYGVPTVLLGDQHAPCRDTRARLCPVPGHPCLSGVHPADVVEAVASLLTASRHVSISGSGGRDMRVLHWHVHGSWSTAFVRGNHTYLVPVTPDRDADGRGRAQTFDWPANAVEITPEALAGADVDVVVLQRPHELELTQQWLGRRPGREVPAVYVEHNTPRGDVPNTRHPLADRSDIPVVHVTPFNELFWDCGCAPTLVIEHGIPDPGYRYTGDIPHAAVVINEPVRRWRVTGTDLLPRFAAQAPLDVFGMAVSQLPANGRITTFEDLPQARMHAELARRRVYIHPIRWTSLGLSLLEAMLLGMPVVALATTEVVEAVPPDAGVVSTRIDLLARALRAFIADPDLAEHTGVAARAAARRRYALDRFCTDWDQLIKEVSR